MRIELEDTNKKVNEGVDASGLAAESSKSSTGTENNKSNTNGVHDEIKEQKAKFKDLDFKHKLGYIWDYYKWYFVIAVAVIVFGTVFIRDYVDNLRPTYLTVEMMNTYFGADSTNTVEDDFVSQYNIDLETYHLYIETDIVLSTESFDTMALANQQKLVSMYSAQELDVVIGPKKVLEGPANCDCYADFNEILPEDLIADLKDRDYEFYYFDPASDEIDDYGEVREPYFAGIYLDNCSYLNNNGESGAYPVATTEEDRPVFTIAANTKNLDHAIEFLKFLVQNK